MKTETVKLSQVRVNGANPRTITDAKFQKLIDSLLALPKMLEIRPIVVDGTMTALGGNMRYRALVAIAGMGDGEISQRIMSIRDVQKKTQPERDALLGWWTEWRKKKEIAVVRASELTEDERRQFIIKDNASFGQWDFDMLANEWDTAELNDWGVGLPDDWGGNEADKYGDTFSLPDGDKGDGQNMTFTLSASQAETIGNAVKDMKKMRKEECAEYDGNTNTNGNALFLIIQEWAGRKK